MKPEFANLSRASRALITLQDVSQRYGTRQVLRDVSLQICQGDFVAITGPNGGGKTTLLRIILRLLRPTHGTVSYSQPPFQIGYLPQKNMVDARFPITVEEVVASGLLACRGLTKTEQQTMIDEALEAVDLQERRCQPIGELSGGQLQRTLLSRALVSHPQLLVLDEPLSYVDRAFTQHLYSLLEQMRQRVTVILVSHEMNVIDRMANCHWMVDCTITPCRAPHHGPISPLECPCNSSK